MRARTRAMILVAAVAGLVALSALAGLPAAVAHPLGNFTVNRASGIVVSPARVEIHYVLDLAEIPTFQERPVIDTNGDGVETEAERAAYANAEAAALLRGVTMTAAGRPVVLHVEGVLLRYLPGQAGLPTLRLEATFAGAIAARGSVEYRDGNFPGRIGWKEVTVRSAGAVTVTASTVPRVSVSQDLLAYPKDLLSSPLDVTVATFRYGPGTPAVIRHEDIAGPTVRTVPIAGGGAFAGLIRWRLSPFLLALSLALAFLFGAVHALGPGHGKTITAAYLVGSGARVAQAVAAGAAVALMHTASVLSLGFLLLVLTRSLPAERVYPWLTVLMGVVALGLGAALFVTRLRRGRAAGHAHDRGHDHAPDHGHDHARSDRHPHAPPLRGTGLGALAVAGGVLPSPTAFVVLAGSITSHRIAYGLTLIAAFSVGLAAALILVGLLALRAREAVGTRVHGRIAGLVPLISALVIMGFGLFFAIRGATQIR